jgi:hypothetical protein
VKRVTLVLYDLVTDPMAKRHASYLRLIGREKTRAILLA